MSCVFCQLGQGVGSLRDTPNGILGAKLALQLRSMPSSTSARSSSVGGTWIPFQSAPSIITAVRVAPILPSGNALRANLVHRRDGVPTTRAQRARSGHRPRTDSFIVFSALSRIAP